MTSRIVKFIFPLVVLSGATVRGDVILLNQWLMAAGINDFNQMPSSALVFFNVPVNPFISSHSAILGGAVASANYNFSWSDASANFQVYCGLVGTGYPNGNADVQTVSCNGNIRLTPSVDALLSVQAHMDYALGPGDREASGGWTVSRPPTPAPIALANFFAQPAFGDPPTDVWDSQNSLMLLAGQQYLLRYAFEVASLPGSGTQSQLSHGNASVHFNIVPIPEPAALGLLAFGALLIRRRCRY